MVYLNNAASGWPKAPGVAEAVRAATEAPPYSPGRADAIGEDPLAECRTRLARLLGTDDASRIVLTSGATHALNLAILGLGLRDHSHAITTVTEHNSVLRPLNHLADRGDARITVIGLDGSGSVDVGEFEAALRHGARLVAVSHVSNVTGRACDVAPLFARAKAAGAVTLLDASQSVGRIPVHPADVHADLVAFTGHKGLHGPSGTGALYAAPGIELDRVIVGGTGVRSDLELHPEGMPIRLEAGTPNVPAFAGLAAALRWLETDGAAREADALRLGRVLHSSLEEMSTIKLFSSLEDSERSGIVSFTADGWSVEEAGIVLQESFGIVCRTGLHCAPLVHHAIGSAPEGTVRLSLSGLSTDDDIQQAADAVRRLAA